MAKLHIDHKKTGLLAGFFYDCNISGRFYARPGGFTPARRLYALRPILRSNQVALSLPGDLARQMADQRHGFFHNQRKVCRQQQFGFTVHLYQQLA